jgi:hypothetical protein
MGCGTREQLDVILKRAGSVPLRLDVFWPVRPGTLELIASLQSPIEYLNLRNSYRSNFTNRRFKDINLKSLRELHIGSPCESAEALMDLALCSTQSDFNLHLTVEYSGIHLLRHQLLQRATRLEIYPCRSILLYPVESSNCIDRIDFDTILPISNGFHDRITLQRAKKIILRSDLKLVDIFDLSNIEVLGLIGGLDFWDLRDNPSIQSLVTTPLPTQLVELVLSSLVLDYNATTDLPHCLPNLTKLRMRYMGLHAPLLQYFKFPRLKYLLLELALCMQPNSRMHTLAPPLLNDLFFRSVPELEFLSIQDMKHVDKALVTGIHFCLSLQKLQIQSTVVKKFIPTFSHRIKDPKFLPNLAYISIRQSWPSNMDMDHREFIAQGQVDRTGLKMEVTDDPYYSSIHILDSSSETSYSSSSTSSST